MKNIKTFTCLLLLLSWLSCKKDSINSEFNNKSFFEHTTRNDLVNWAISNLEVQNLKSSFAHKIYLQNGLPLWDYSDAFYAYEGMPTIVVPFVDKDIKDVKAIWVIVYDKGQMKSKIITGDKIASTQQANRSNKMTGDFSQMFRYLKGKIFEPHLKLSNAIGKLASSEPIIREKTSYYITVESCIDWFQYASVGGVYIPDSFQYTNTTCKSEMVWIPEISPNSTTPPNFSAPPPAGYLNLTPISFAKITMDPANRDCLSKITSDITNYASLAHNLQRVFGGVTGYENVNSMIDRLSNSTSWNVVIKEGNLIPEIDEDGNTKQQNATTLASGGTVTITFNKAYLNVATDLAIARTLIHELMHTYFEYGKSQISDPGYSSFTAVNDLLYNRNGAALKGQNLAQHNLIASCYVDEMGYLLYAYAQSKGILSPNSNMSLMDYCRDLAWGGLKDSKGYNFVKNKTRVEANIMKEQNNTSGSSNVKSCL